MTEKIEKEIDKIEEKINVMEKNQSQLGNFKNKYPGIFMLVAIISVFGTIFTTANLWFGVQVRPAWHWEYEGVRQDIITLEIAQSDLRRILHNRDLARYNSLREGYINRGDIVPDWLDEQIATTDAIILRISEDIANLKQTH